jgi:hypothetical protein
MFNRKKLRDPRLDNPCWNNQSIKETEYEIKDDKIKELKSLIHRFVRVANINHGFVIHLDPETAFSLHVQNLEDAEKERQEMAELTVKVEKILQDKGLIPFSGQKAVFDCNEYATSSESNQPPFQHYEEIKIKTPDKTNLAAAAKAVVEWEEEYRTINNLGDSPECFKHLKEILNAV